MMKTAVIRTIKGISIRFLIVAVIFGLFLLLFIAIAHEMVLENENHLDFVVFSKLGEITSTSMTRLMLVITWFGSSDFLLPAYLVLIGYFLISRKTRKLSLDVAAVGVSSTIILFSLKAIFHRHRPLDPLIQNVNGFSFPSGHSFSAFTFFGLLIYIVWNHPVSPVSRWSLTIFFFLAACAVAISRVYLHVHYASDVVAGFCLCLVWLGLSFGVIKKYQHRLP
jgi:undecaprenyl-diphosphatase